jgi:hypothetical protein
MEQGQFNITGIPGTPEPTDRDKLRARVELGLAVFFGILFTLLLIGALTDALQLHQDKHASRGGLIALAVVAIGLLVLCFEWARSAEHRLKLVQGHPVANAFELSNQAAVVTSGADPPIAETRRERVRRLRRKRRYGPRGTAAATVIYVLATIGLIVAAFALRSDADRSAYTQSHGVASTGTVTNVDNIQTCGRYSCSYHAHIAVTLNPPVEGHATSTVSYPAFSSVNVGDQIQVLVDPQQPDYAELPGSPSVKPGQWIGLLVFGVVFALLAVFMGRRLKRMLAARKQVATGGPAALAPT